MVYNYLDLIDRIDSVIFENTTNGIKAENMKQLFKDIIDSQVNMVYDTNREYKPNAFCVYDGGGGYKGYVCITPTTGAFTLADWSQLGV